MPKNADPQTTTTAKRLSPRLRYFLGHLGVSITVFCLALGAVYWLWYPAPLAKMLGVMPIVLMMGAVDVVLGPSLSFVVYKVGKKTLKMDLAVIVLLQLIAFGYGMHTIYAGRPAYLTLDEHNFLPVAVADVQYSAKTPPQYARAPISPVMVALDPPGGLSIRDLYHNLPEQGNFYPEYYAPIAPGHLADKGHALEILYNKNDAQAVDAALAQHPGATHYIPLSGGVVDMAVLIDQDAGAVLGIVDLAPW